jgi:hypothetical protein
MKGLTSIGAFTGRGTVIDLADRHIEDDLRLPWWNGVVKMFAAWVTLVLTSILALGVLLFLIDLIFTKIANGSVYAYAAMAIALVLFSGTAYAAFRSFQRIHPQPS